MARSWWWRCWSFPMASTAVCAACSPWLARAGPGRRPITRGWWIGTIPRGAKCPHPALPQKGRVNQRTHSKEVRLNIQINHMTSAMSRIASGCAVALLAACGESSGSTNTASAPGITGTEIKIGSTQPLTGPAAPGYSEIAPAANAYVQYVNAHGGIFGRKITYDSLDDGYNPTTTSSATRKLDLQDKVFAMFNALGTPTHLAVVDYFHM